MDPHESATMADIYNLQVAVRQLGHDLTANTHLLHEIKERLITLENVVNKEIVPLVNESRY